MLLYVVGIAVLIALDQITKYLATLYLAPVGAVSYTHLDVYKRQRRN